jgi:hypothetical protein
VWPLRICILGSRRRSAAGCVRVVGVGRLSRIPIRPRTVKKKKGDAGWCSARPLRYRMKNSNELLRLTGDVAYCGGKKFN